MKAVSLLVLAAALLQEPALHTRPSVPEDEVPIRADGHTELPPEAEGTYPWNKRGGRIVLYFEEGTLRGYMAELDGAAAVTLPFTATHIQGEALSFTTRKVHGHSYGFTGRLRQELTPGQPLPYVLTGTLSETGKAPVPVRAERARGLGLP